MKYFNITITTDSSERPLTLDENGSRDGDAFELHSDHNVVKSYTGMPGNEKVFWYCKDCKVEVRK